MGRQAAVEATTGWDISGWSTAGVKEKEEREKRGKAREAARACWKGRIGQIQA